MLHRVLGIGKWVVDFLFADEGYDEEGVLSCLYDIDAPVDVMQRAYRIMESGRYNRGFTYNNESLMRSVVVVGPTTSGKQFLNTVSHEVRHLADGIARHLGVDLDSERPAYITGDAVMALGEVLCEMGCERCRGVK